MSTYRHLDANRRRVIWIAATWTLGCAGLGVFSYATLEFDPNQGHFAPPWVSFVFIACGISAVITSNVAGNLRAVDAMVRAFKIGFEAAEKQFKDMNKKGK